MTKVKERITSMKGRISQTKSDLKKAIRKGDQNLIDKLEARLENQKEHLEELEGQL